MRKWHSITNMSNWFLLQIIIPFSINMLDCFNFCFSGMVTSLLWNYFSSFSHSIPALVLQHLKSCSQPGFACIPRHEKSYQCLCNWPTILGSQPKILWWLKSKVSEIFRIQQYFCVNGWTSVVGNITLTPLQGMQDKIIFAYSSSAWVYQAFKGELSLPYVFLWQKSQGRWNLWEHFGNANMDLSSCQDNG